MTAFVDTNILVRHLTGDPPRLATRATAFLATGRRLYLTDLVACAESTGIDAIASFDKTLDRITTVSRIEP